MPKGYLAIVLHAHLPFVRHPEYTSFLEERWLFEAITETYLPLLKMLAGLVREQIPCRLTVSLSPPLLAMMRDPLLQDRYRQHLKRSLSCAQKSWSAPGMNRTCTILRACTMVCFRRPATCL